MLDKPLCILFPCLYKISEQPDISVQQVWNDVAAFTFTRWLVDDLRTNWGLILDELKNFQFTDEMDTINWRLEPKRNLVLNPPIMP